MKRDRLNVGRLSCDIRVWVGVYGYQVQSWFRVGVVPFSARPCFGTVKIACHDLVLQSTALPGDSSGFHLCAGVVVWQGTTLPRDHDSVATCIVCVACSV